MTLRRTIRQSAKSGTQLPAVVEEYALGLATVRLASNGQRLTNLSTLGRELLAGDNVIVDYSAGIEPIVRKETIEPTAETLPEPLEEETTEEPAVGELGDWCVHAMVFGSIDGYEYLYKGTPRCVPFYANVGAYGWWFYSAALYQCGYHCDTVTHYGRDYLDVIQPGKYHISAAWCEEITQPYHHTVFEGYARVRVLVNGTPIAEAYSYDFKGRYEAFRLCTSTIWYLNAGDRVQLELLQTMCPQYWLDNYWIDSPEEVSRCVNFQYLPGTLVPT